MSRVGIVGSRAYADLLHVREYVNGMDIWDVVVTGGARGVDRAAEVAARQRGMIVVIHAADWRMHGKAAGPIRNAIIVSDVDLLVAFWDGSSRGTLDAMTTAKREGVPVIVFRTPVPPARP